MKTSAKRGEAFVLQNTSWRPPPTSSTTLKQLVRVKGSQLMDPGDFVAAYAEFHGRHSTVLGIPGGGNRHLAGFVRCSRYFWAELQRELGAFYLSW
jgi:hypothetical protein